MHSYVEDFCAHCETCLKNKGGRVSKEPLQPYTLDELKPRSVIAFDIATLPWATNQYRYFLVIVDLFSKYCEAVPMKDQLAVTIEKALLDSWVHRHGRPDIAVSDQAKNVDGQVVNDLREKLGIEKRHSSPYHPEGNGQAERSVQTIKTLIRCVMAEEQLPKYAWPSILQKATFMNNTTVNSSTKFSPYELMYGTQAMLPSVKSSPSVGPSEAVDATDLLEETEASVGRKWSAAATNLGVAKTQYKKQYDDRNTSKTKAINTGDYVYLKNQTRHSSLDPYYHGPYEVLSVDDCTVTVHSDRRGRVTVHKNHVRPSQTTEVIVLPSAHPPRDPPEEMAVDEPNHELPQDPSEEGEGAQYAGGFDPLQLPIALRKPCRHKPKALSSDFVSR